MLIEDKHKKETVTVQEFINLVLKSNNMKDSKFNRRNFIKSTTAAATGLSIFSILPKNILANPSKMVVADGGKAKTWAEPRIKFSVIGINHNHIYSQVDAVTRGGGQLVSFYAKEDELATAFSKKYPLAK